MEEHHMVLCFHPYPPTIKKVMNIFYFSFSFRNMQIDSFALLSLFPIFVLLDSRLNSLQKHLSRGVLRKSCCENMQQIQENTHAANLLQIFRTPFS